MGRTELLQGLRTMKVETLLERWQRSELSQADGTRAGLRKALHGGRRRYVPRVASAVFTGEVMAGDGRGMDGISLPLVRYRFAYRALGDGVLRAFGGSAWRGVFGHALKRVVCAMRLRACAGCPLIDGCPYPALFDGHMAAGLARPPGIDVVTVPYVFAPEHRGDTVFVAGDTVSTVLTLVGTANARLVYVVRAMAEAGLAGLGPARAQLQLTRVEALDGLDAATGTLVHDGGARCLPVAPRSPQAVPLGRHVVASLRTPLRLRLDGDLVTPQAFRPAHLIGAAIRRVSTLAALHGGGPIAADYGALKRAADMARLEEADLGWQDQTRFSARQRETMKMGGLVGTCRIDLGPDAGSLGPWLDLAQWVGAGKGASMGLGAFRIATAVPR